MFEGADDLTDLVADRARIDVDVVVNSRQFAQQRLGNLAIRRNDNFAGFSVHHIQRNLFAQKDIGERFSQFFVQLFLLLSVVFSESVWPAAWSPPESISASLLLSAKRPSHPSRCRKSRMGR